MHRIDIKELDQKSKLKEEELNLKLQLHKYFCFCQRQYANETTLRLHLKNKHFEFTQKIKKINLHKIMIKQISNEGIQFARLVELDDNTLQRIKNNEEIKMDNFNSDSTVFAFENKIFFQFPFKEKGRFFFYSKKAKKQIGQQQKNNVVYTCFCGYSTPKILLFKQHTFKMHLSSFKKINFLRLNNLLTQQQYQNGSINYHFNLQDIFIIENLENIRSQISYHSNLTQNHNQQENNEIVDLDYQTISKKLNNEIDWESFLNQQVNINYITPSMLLKVGKALTSKGHKQQLLIDKDKQQSFQKLQHESD